MHSFNGRQEYQITKLRPTQALQTNLFETLTSERYSCFDEGCPTKA